MAGILAPYLLTFATYQVAALGLLGFCGLFALTWGQLVGGLFLSLTGRAWVVNGVLACYLMLLIVPGLTGRWVATNAAGFDTFLTPLSWFLAGLAGVKLLAAGWALRARCRQDLLRDSNLGHVLGIWFLGACCLATFVLWLLPAEGLSLTAEVGAGVHHVPTSLIALATVLALPLVRPLAAPLALAWNRHR